ncbi:hypothetical protein KBD49_01685 [Myxococcota bacterium]|nr:hypothetical protein [Myxococcota bacterium]
MHPRREDVPHRCFPALLPRKDGTYRIYNYTSPLDGPDLSWIEGQMGPTVIVSTDLAFRPRGSDQGPEDGAPAVP